MNKELMFSSKSDVWSTPQDFYDKYNAKYHFNLDPCATSENAKCEKYYTEEDNGLIQNWGVIECSAILLMAEELESGLQKDMQRAKSQTQQLLCFCQQEQIRHGFTTIAQKEKLNFCVEG